MDKKLFIGALAKGATHSLLAAVAGKQTKVAKNGKPYLDVILADSTGTLPCKVWDNADKLGAGWEKDDYVLVTVKVDEYQGKPQGSISEATRVDPATINPADFLPKSKFDVKAMAEELTGYMTSVKDPDLQGLLRGFFSDREFWKAFKTAPAASAYHHAWVSGLLEHTLNVARLVDLNAPHYPSVNRDMVMTGAILHDIGKVHELQVKATISYSEQGDLLGHLAMGSEMVSQVAAKVGTPIDKVLQVKHMILSHHGKLEFGSPKEPMTREAIMLNFLDDMDAKIQAVDTFIGNATPNGRSCGRHYLMGRNIYDFEPKQEGPDDSGFPEVTGQQDLFPT